jgi:hypothetical protein
VDGLMAHGRLDKLKNGPVYWIDCAGASRTVVSRLFGAHMLRWC